MLFSTTYFTTREKVASYSCPAPPRRCPRFSWPAGQLGAASSSGITRASAQFVCCHVDVSSIPTLIDNFGSKSSRKSWRRTVHVSDSAWVAAQAGLCKENRQGPLSPASLGFGSRPSSFQAMKGQPVPGGAHRELLLSSTLSVHT